MNTQYRTPSRGTLWKALYLRRKCSRSVRNGKDGGAFGGGRKLLAQIYQDVEEYMQAISEGVGLWSHKIPSSIRFNTNCRLAMDLSVHLCFLNTAQQCSQSSFLVYWTCCPTLFCSAMV